MTRFSRRGFIKATTVATMAGWGSTLLPSRVKAADFRYKLAHEFPATHPTHIRATEAFARVASRSQGRLQVDVFPNNQLGGATEMLGQVRSGALEFMTLSTVILSNLVPSAAISGVGFAFADYDHVWRAMDGKLGEYVRSQIAGSRLIAMERMWDLGFRQVATNSKPVNSPADLSGLKVRVPVAALYVSLFKSLGAAPASLNFSELYTALQTKVVDGTENPLQILISTKLYEVTKYCSVTNHMWDGQWLLANPRAYKELPVDLQSLFAEEVNAAALKQRADIATLDQQAKGELVTKGMLFNSTDAQTFRAKLREAGFYAEWKNKFDPQAWALLEEITGPLG